MTNMHQYESKIAEFGAALKKKKRAATKHVASIALSDLAKYFDLPIVEASKNLKVGLTVLKRKCREFGIPRWPHRKIKSLDTLIHNLQMEVERQERENEAAAAKAAAKRRRMLEAEKKSIETQPCKELQSETKRFREDVFKRRHRAKAQNPPSASSSQPLPSLIISTTIQTNTTDSASRRHVPYQQISVSTTC